MRKIFLLFVFIFLVCKKQFAQDSTINKDDSLALNDLMGLLHAADRPSSYVSINAGIGNRLFSQRNNAINSKQTSTSTLIYSPSVGYYHKSGVSLSAGVNLLNDPAKGFTASQFSISPAFDLLGNKYVSAGISYARYFVNDKYSVYASPVQDDWYAYINYKKTWLEPGIAAGYSSGKFTEIFSFKLPLTGIVLTDTGVYKIKSFSMIASLKHDFEWYEIFGKKDGIVFTPSLQLNLSSDSTKSVSHTVQRTQLRNLRVKRRLPKLQGKNSFEAQSLGLNLDINYSIGHFIMEPQLYLDYYLPQTDEKRFTTVFAFSIGYIF